MFWVSTIDVAVKLPKAPLLKERLPGVDTVKTTVPKICVLSPVKYPAWEPQETRFPRVICVAVLMLPVSPDPVVEGAPMSAKACEPVTPLARPIEQKASETSSEQALPIRRRRIVM